MDPSRSPWSAYFIPGIVYLADAVGTQTETLAIRGLSVEVGIGRVARREATTGLLVDFILAAVMFPTISWLWHDVALPAAVSLAVLTMPITARARCAARFAAPLLT